MKNNLLDRYIARTVLASIALITLLLAGLQLFILFVNELNDLGRGNYGLVQSAGFVLLQIPYQVYLFFPMASLLGSLIGLGILANHHELVVMRSAGMSVWQVSLAVLKAALVVIVLVTLIGETWVPSLTELANNKKLQALSNNQALRTDKGIWLRHETDFINIQRVLDPHTLSGVYQFRFDKTHHLALARVIHVLRYHEGAWHAEGVSESRFADGKVEAAHHDRVPWDVSLKPHLLTVTTREPDEMTLHELRQFLRIQKKNHQSVQNYQLAYWHRILQPLTTAVMMIIAIPFIFGPLRTSTMGSKLLAGAIMGFSFHMMNRIFGPISQVLQWPAEIAAIAPTLIFAVLGFYWMQRVR